MGTPRNGSTKSVEIESPAKLNLLLSVHGKRSDGFHDLTSLMVAVGFADRLRVTLGGETDGLVVEGADLSTGTDNLVLRAAEAFRAHTGIKDHFEFVLEKRIPVGAGLGGGSSNAVAALQAMNALSVAGLSPAVLREIAATLGSDCPFFVEAMPSIVSGRGERIEALPSGAGKRIVGTKVALFRPEFGVATGWAYGALARAGHYEGKPAAEARLGRFEDSGDVADLLFNSFEDVVGRKFVALSALLSSIREEGHACLLSGSGSCCFVLLPEDEAMVSGIRDKVIQSWGAGAFWVETRIC